MWSGSLISALLGTVLPGPGTIYLEQDIQFKKPVRLGDTITLTIIVKDKRKDKPTAIFDCKGVNQRGEIVIERVATVLAPMEKIRVERAHLPPIEIYNHDHFEAIIKACRCMGAIRTAIVHPVSSNVSTNFIGHFVPYKAESYMVSCNALPCVNSLLIH